MFVTVCVSMRVAIVEWHQVIYELGVLFFPNFPTQTSAQFKGCSALFLVESQKSLTSHLPLISSNAQLHSFNLTFLFIYLFLLKELL